MLCAQAAPPHETGAAAERYVCGGAGRVRKAERLMVCVPHQAGATTCRHICQAVMG